MNQPAPDEQWISRSSNADKRRRWKRYFIFLIVVLVGVNFASIAIWHRNNVSEHKGTIEVSKLGGTYGMESAVQLRKTGKRPSWLHRRVLNRVSQIDLSADSWSRAKRLKEGTKVPDVTDSELKVLLLFVRLNKVDLHGSQIGDGCFDVLSQLKSLEELNLKDTDVSASVIDKLRDTLPNCKIIVD